ncbi:MAG TPA: methionyl-tRNA formyltransferase [Verrucomicrobiae bacterium]|nr:methionyl-tRNA formyltransferase [Verrucomicrobiae bacterium]
MPDTTRYICLSPASVLSFAVAMPLRIVFMGTPALAAESLRALLAAREFEVAAVVSQPDQPKGRGLKLQPTPVKELAVESGIPVLQPERARNDSFIEQLRGFSPELIAVTAYGQILPKAILDLPRFGCLNVHTSLLPKFRGAAPIQRAILEGESETGVTIMKMDVGLDTGDILTQARTPIHDEDHAQTLHDRLARIGAELLVKTIPDYVAGRIQPQPQPTEGVSHAAKIRKTEGQIKWSDSARAVWNRIRAMTPWPGAYSHLQTSAQPLLLKLWAAHPRPDSGPAGEILAADKSGIVVACGEGSVAVTALQREGGRRMAVQEFLAGNPLMKGQRFMIYDG